MRKANNTGWIYLKSPDTAGMATFRVLIRVSSQLFRSEPKPLRDSPSITPPRGSVHNSSAQVAPSSIAQVPASQAGKAGCATVCAGSGAANSKAARISFFIKRSVISRR